MAPLLNRAKNGLEDDLLALRARALDADQAAVWIQLVSERALALRAHELAGQDPSALPLYGVPFAVKDNIDVAGLTTTAGCPAWATRPDDDAVAVERLLAAGAVVIGKTNLDQFATGLVGVRSPFGVPRNALDPALVPGGSSSGSAVAVATGAVAFALGTDTAGSGRVPAALNGIVGLKPTRGRIPTHGVVPACRSLDCVSIFARDPLLADRVLRVLDGPDRRDPLSMRRRETAGAWSSGRPRLGVPRLGLPDFAGDEQMRDAWNRSVELVQRGGAELVEVDLAPFLSAGELLYDGPWVAERDAAVGAFVREQPDAVLPVTREIILGGASWSAVDAFRAGYELQRLEVETRTTWAQVDALLLPTVPTLPTLADLASDPVGPNALLGRFTTFVNLLDLAAIAVPMGTRADGRPNGVTLVGPAFSDESLSVAGRWLMELALEAPPAAVSDLLVLGAHMTGMPLEPQLRQLGAKPSEAVRTAAGYRLLALDQLDPPRPGLVADPAGDGLVEGELWSVSPNGLAELLRSLAPPLGLGPVRLEDDRIVTGFLCQAGAAGGAADITASGGWRAHVAGDRESGR